MDKLATSYRPTANIKHKLAMSQGSYGETSLVKFGLYSTVSVAHRHDSVQYPVL